MGLTNFKIKSAAIGKRHHDGGGLYLTLSARYRGKWTIRDMINRKAKEIGLGQYPELSFADASKKHFEARIIIAEGKSAQFNFCCTKPSPSHLLHPLIASSL